MHQSLNDLVTWLRETAAHSHGLLVPISGGSDSALCFWICTQAFPEHTLGVYAGDALRSRDWFEARGRIQIIPAPEGKTPREREVHRWATMLDLGLMELRWLVGSRNRTEDAFGTYSLASRLATILPLVGLWKSEVMELCRHAGVPELILASSRHADPECGRPHKLAEIPLELIDRYLWVKSGLRDPDALSTLSQDQIEYLDGVYVYNTFKKDLPLRGITVR